VARAGMSRPGINGGRGGVAVGYRVGDRVWMHHAETREVKLTCPVCAGNRIVTLILGSGESVELPCDYCGKGFEGPRGVVTEWEYSRGAEQLTIHEVRSIMTEKGEEVEYRLTDNRVGRDGEMFASRREAEVDCERVCTEIALAERTRAEYIKKDQARSYSWNAGYHMREAKRSEKQAEYHRSKFALCKAKCKESNGGGKG
jgi:hypothetical protein